MPVVFIHPTTTPNGAKVKMTFGIGHDVSKQTLTLSRTERHFPVSHSASLTKISIAIHKLCFEKKHIKGKSYILCNLQSDFDTAVTSLLVFNKMAAKLFSSQNKSSSDERDSLTPGKYALDPVQYEKNIARLFQCKVNCKVNWDFF